MELKISTIVDVTADSQKKASKGNRILHRQSHPVEMRDRRALLPRCAYARGGLIGLSLGPMSRGHCWLSLDLAPNCANTWPQLDYYRPIPIHVRSIGCRIIRRIGRMLLYVCSPIFGPVAERWNRIDSTSFCLNSLPRLGHLPILPIDPTTRAGYGDLLGPVAAIYHPLFLISSAS